ncbi:hypothetical protein H8356DRAFT_1346756 [Neocallimastix lanati (nom. inval.)]|nr:hypothetical protein H8356DRAFT_1346756 [Neocallimastix sp. JGI-2020a]
MISMKTTEVLNLPFKDFLRGAQFQKKSATYSLENVFETKINKIAKILKKSDYSKRLKVFEIMSKRWQEEAIKKNY